MRSAYIFPGQGTQFPGMGAELFAYYPKARQMFDAADEHLGFSLSDIMFHGTAERLKETRVTQPAVFLHAVVEASCLFADAEPPDAVAGHSLGEFSALVAAGMLSFLDALDLVTCRAAAMVEACNAQASTMAAVLGTPADTVLQVCKAVQEEKKEIVVLANYNCPGQLVISGTIRGIEQATTALKAAGAKRVLPLAVGGAFHSPLMAPAQKKLTAAIERTTFTPPCCPVYQNVDGQSSRDVAIIQQKLIQQLTAPVYWEKQVQQMVQDGYAHFVECGSGTVLQGLIKKIAPSSTVQQAATILEQDT